MRTLTFALAFLSIAAAAACGPGRPPVPVGPPPPGPRTVAILPLANTTTSVDGPAVLREHLAPRVAQRGYVVQNLGDTDEAMRSIGITLGGQVPGVKIAELRKALGTDAALGGTLLKHSNIVLGVANQQTLEAEIVLIDLTNGRVIDRQRRKVVHQEDFGTRGNGAGALIGGAIGVASGISRNALKKESDQLAAIFANYLPRPGMGYPPYGAPPPPAPTGTPMGPSTEGASPTPFVDNPGDAVWPGAGQ